MECDLEAKLQELIISIIACLKVIWVSIIPKERAFRAGNISHEFASSLSEILTSLT